jgi:anti-anti-sigma regulatory factor
MITLVVGDSIAAAEVPLLCARLRTALEEADAEVVVCDLTTVVRADLDTVDAVARLQLTARRCGARMRLRRCSPELGALLAFAGLAEELPVED